MFARFKYKSKEINEFVVIAPWWKPDIFPCFEAKIDTASNGGHCNVWNICIDGLNTTYIRTGIEAPVVGYISLVLGCTLCKLEKQCIQMNSCLKG